MKQSTIFYAILFAILMGWLNSNAQTKADTVYVKLHKNQLATLQQVLQFSFQWLPTSGATGTDISGVQGAIKILYPVIVADTVKRKVEGKKP